MKPILEIQNISKRFTINEGSSVLSLRESLYNLFSGKGNQNRSTFHALQDVSFDVLPGESIGIIGNNGAGKSTLLKILSKITPPSSGKIVSRGRIASLLEVGTGFHSELTGRENIYLNGSILGLKKKEIDSQFDAIVGFSGVEKFLDTPLKRYSSGMQLRLAFAVAAHLEPEILIIDEVLAVGDVEFQKKCIGKMGEISKGGRTVLFVSHDLNAVSKLCSKVCLLQKGKVSFFGESMKGILKYQEHESHDTVFLGEGSPEKPVFIKKVEVFNGNFRESSSGFLYNQPVSINFEIGINDPKVKCDLFVLVLDSHKRRICAFESNSIANEMQLNIAPEFLVRGKYSLYVFLNQPNIARLDEAHDICHFEIIDNGSQMLKHGDYDYGQVFGKGEWRTQ